VRPIEVATTETGSKRWLETRRGQHSIRINDKWRICFIWSSEGPVNVEIVDYH
jgi:plasmid maintenance system killer protein